MKRFNRILVVCQDDSQSELAIERARNLAKANDAAITLMDVVDIDHRELASIFSNMSDRMSDDMQNQIFDYHRTRLERYADMLRAEGIPTTATVLKGLPFVELIRAVIRDRHDIVIKGANPVTSPKRSIFVGLDMHLLRKCPCPVWIIKCPLLQKSARLLAAVDPDFDDPERASLTGLVMELSTSLCSAEEGHLHVVHAWKLQEEQALLSSRMIKANALEVSKIRQMKRSHHARELDRLVSRYTDPDKRHKSHLLKGDAGEVVPDFARKNKVDLVVMGTVSRTDVAGLFIGNTAEMILNRIGCSVLAVKPPHFQTPVDLNSETDHPKDAANASKRPAALG